MIDLQKKIEERFETGKEESKHLITIAASTIPAQYLLPKILMKFNERYPKEQVKLLETDSSQVVTQIIDHMVDVGFTVRFWRRNTVNISHFIKMNWL